MSIHLTIYDEATPTLDKIALLSKHSALAALDQAGMELRDATRKAFRESMPSKYKVTIVNGKRVWTKGGLNSEFGKRLNHKKAGPNSMGDMINSFLMDRQMTMVVSGMHKSFTPRFYSAESKQGTTDAIFGRKVGQVLGGSWQILKKLNDGGRFKNLDPKYKGTRMGEDTKPIGKDGNPRYEGRHFIERGRSMAMGRVQDIMTAKLEALIYKQVNRATVKAVERVS